MTQLTQLEIELYREVVRSKLMLIKLASSISGLSVALAYLSPVVKDENLNKFFNKLQSVNADAIAIVDLAKLPLEVKP